MRAFSYEDPVALGQSSRGDEGTKEALAAVETQDEAIEFAVRLEGIDTMMSWSPAGASTAKGQGMRSRPQQRRRQGATRRIPSHALWLSASYEALAEALRSRNPLRHGWRWWFRQALARETLMPAMNQETGAPALSRPSANAERGRPQFVEPVAFRT